MPIIQPHAAEVQIDDSCRQKPDPSRRPTRYVASRLSRALGWVWKLVTRAIEVQSRDLGPGRAPDTASRVSRSLYLLPEISLVVLDRQAEWISNADGFWIASRRFSPRLRGLAQPETRP